MKPRPNSQMQSDGLNSFLNELSGQGRQDSEGEFTLLLSHSLDKLQKFQLVDPNLYVVNLVSLAVLCGAKRINFCHDGQETTVEFDGRLFEQEELEEVFQSSDPALKELMVALVAVKSLKPKNLYFESRGIIDWSDEAPKFTRSQTGTCNTFVLGQPVDTLSLLLRKVQSEVSRPRWFNALCQVCQYASVVITVNQKVANTQTLQVQVPALHLDYPELALPKMRKLGHSETDIHKQVSPGKFSAILSSHQSGMLASRAKRWTFVHRGVSFARTFEDERFGGLTGIVRCDSLQKNLSQTDIVEDETYTRLLTSLESCAVRFVREILTQKSIDREEMANWDKVALWVGQRLQDSGLKKEAVRVEAWAYAHRNRHRVMAFSKRDRLKGRYSHPGYFLVSYLHWFGSEDVVKQIMSLNEAIGWDGPPESILLFWTEGADANYLQTVFKAVLSDFPASLSWQALYPLIQRMPKSESLYGHLRARLRGVSFTWRSEKSVCEAALYLENKGQLDFCDWLKRALSSGVVGRIAELSEWLRSTPHATKAAGIVAQFLNSQQDNLQREAVLLYGAFLKNKAATLEGVEEAVVVAYEACRDDDSRHDLLGFASAFGATVQIETKPGRGAWCIHRYALTLICRGLFKMGLGWHTLAHSKLKKHWLSHLLLGDAAVARGDEASARHHYRRCLELNEDCVEARELLAELSPPSERRASWLELAERPGVSDLVKALAYQEALQAIHSPSSFAQWVRLRINASFAQHQVRHTPFPKEANWVYPAWKFSRLSLVQPDLARTVVRGLRKEPRRDLAAQMLARYRLLQQISGDPSECLQWEREVRDSDSSQLEPQVMLKPVFEKDRARTVDPQPEQLNRKDDEKHPRKFKPLR
jgi:hypothetical protein